MTLILFWSLVKKTEKKKGGLTSLKGPDGKVETEREKVADLAITGLANIFNGKKVQFLSPMENR